MRKPRIIKKYPNRRLYDLAESRYVTLADVRKLAIQRVHFVVLDQNDRNADITSTVLLQAILEKQQKGVPVLSRAFLMRLIRSRRRML